MSAFGEQVSTLRRQEQVQQELETCTEDMDRYAMTLSSMIFLLEHPKYSERPAARLVHGN